MFGNIRGTPQGVLLCEATGIFVVYSNEHVLRLAMAKGLLWQKVILKAQELLKNNLLLVYNREVNDRQARSLRDAARPACFLAERPV